MTAQQPSGFDPSRYLTKLSRRARGADGGWKNVELDYMEVKWRLLWLRTEQPEARIETALVKHEGELAIFQARVTLASGAEASGWGSETADDWKDYIEKAETKALGRALAALGFGTQFCTDFDFAEGKPDRVVDAPAAVQPVRPGPQEVPVSASRPSLREGPPSQPAPQGGGTLAVTEPQIKAIYAIARGQHQMDDGALALWVQERFGCALSALSRRQASECIDALKVGGAA